MYEYLYLIAVFFTILLAIAYIKLKYPFWNTQPVFHVYDFWRNFTTTPFYIQTGFPMKTKFYSGKNVSTSAYSDMKHEEILKTLDLIQCCYIPSDRVIITMDVSGLHNNMTGYNNPSYVSFYNDIDYSIEYDPSGLSITNVKEKTLPVACLISKPTRFFFNPNGNMEERCLYYWDYISIHRSYSKKNIIYNLIHSADYNQRIKTPDIHGSIFKKEETLCEGIVPLTQYKNYTFYLRNIKLSPLPPKFTVTRVLSENIGLFSDFLYGIVHPKRANGNENANSPFSIISLPDMGAINALLLSDQLYCYILQNNDHVYGIYVFKNTNINYEDVEEGNLLECAMSISNSDMDGLFFSGFLNSLRSILSLQKKYKMIIFNNTSHNYKLLEKWQWKYTPVFDNNAAYYLYNMVVPGMPFSPSKVAII